ncbi:hypothetical protein CTI12_AA175510 [Artemisia annua]|uniref:Uncharacterized protein n=1 Tax=Artemisia annua TaxID=35608 RepID=A0A2U1P9N0_ARTAN|nr:hypothetical protein CTI12_AA175510 [Artemisia annua]
MTNAGHINTVTTDDSSNVRADLGLIATQFATSLDGDETGVTNLKRKRCFSEQLVLEIGGKRCKTSQGQCGTSKDGTTGDASNIQDELTVGAGQSTIDRLGDDSILREPFMSQFSVPDLRQDETHLLLTKGLKNQNSNRVSSLQLSEESYSKT